MNRSGSVSMGSEQYTLKKWVWTDIDFDEMMWHDVHVHGMALVNDLPHQLELLFDLDYILKWVEPHNPEKEFSFWLVPATLVFSDVFNLSINVEAEQPVYEIDKITREERVNSSGWRTWLWTVRLQQGKISFWSTGYRQYLRRKPVLHCRQYFGYQERGGVSFSQETFAG